MEPSGPSPTRRSATPAGGQAGVQHAGVALLLRCTWLESPAATGVAGGIPPTRILALPRISFTGRGRQRTGLRYIWVRDRPLKNEAGGVARWGYRGHHPGAASRLRGRVAEAPRPALAPELWRRRAGWGHGSGWRAGLLARAAGGDRQAARRAGRHPNRPWGAAGHLRGAGRARGRRRVGAAPPPAAGGAGMSGRRSIQRPPATLRSVSAPGVGDSWSPGAEQTPRPAAAIAAKPPGACGSKLSLEYSRRRLCGSPTRTPIPGRARRYHKMPEVNHRLLIAHLEGSRPMAGRCPPRRTPCGVLPLCPEGARSARGSSPSGPALTHGLHNTWEPLIVVRAARSARAKRDWLQAQPRARRRGAGPGRNPLAFCAWLWSCLSAAAGDSFDRRIPRYRHRRPGLGAAVSSAGVGDRCRQGPGRPVAQRAERQVAMARSSRPDPSCSPWDRSWAVRPRLRPCWSRRRRLASSVLPRLGRAGGGRSGRGDAGAAEQLLSDREVAKARAQREDPGSCGCRRSALAALAEPGPGPQVANVPDRGVAAMTRADERLPP